MFRRGDTVVNFEACPWDQILDQADLLDRLLLAGELQRQIRIGREIQEKVLVEKEADLKAQAAAVVPQSQIQAWIDQLTNGKFVSEHERQGVILKLGGTRDPAAVPILIQHLDDSKFLSLTCNQAIRMLADIGDTRAVAPIVRMLMRPIRRADGHDPDENLRLDQQDLGYSDDQQILRTDLVHALARFNDPAVLPILRQVALSSREYKQVKLVAQQEAKFIESNRQMDEEKAKGIERERQIEAGATRDASARPE